MEKLVDRHIRDGVLGEALPHHQKQNANQTGKSTETRLIKLVMHSASVIEHKEVSFLNIQGPSDITSLITQAAERHGTEPIICRWICSMLGSRIIVITLLEETLRVSTSTGCLRGEGVITS
jgi:hypothetical protein